MINSTGPIPYLLALLICDQVITDVETSKKTVVGIFDRIYCLALPAQRLVTLYVRMTDAAGDYRFKVQNVFLDSDTVIGEAETNTVTIGDRLGIQDMVLRIPALISAYGSYEFRLYANGAFMGRVTYTAAPVNLPGV